MKLKILTETTPPLLCLFKVKKKLCYGAHNWGAFLITHVFISKTYWSQCKRYVVKPKIDLLRNLRITQISLILKDLCEKATKKNIWSFLTAAVHNICFFPYSQWIYAVKKLPTLISNFFSFETLNLGTIQTWLFKFFAS